MYRSIGSIQANTVQDFEIVCVNDGSTDNTLDILRELRAKDERIRIITRPEKGYAITMNEALDNARGDYVLNVDPDDWIETNMLEKLLECMEKDVDFAKCGFVFELPKGVREEYQYSSKKAEFCPRKLPPKQKMEFFVSQVAIWTCLIRRSFIEKHHIRLNETEGAAYQDTAFIFYINSLADKVRVIPDTLYHYNKTNANASTASSRYPLAPSVEYRKMAEWCLENPQYGIYVRSVLCRSRFGSYCWNLARIKREDRMEFAKMAQEDFKTDYDFIDMRMFTQAEEDLYYATIMNPACFVEAIENVERG